MAPARKLTRTSLFDRSALMAFLEDGLGPKRGTDTAAKHCRAILHAAVRDAEAGLDAVDLSKSRVPGIPQFARDQIPRKFALITTTIADCQTSKDGSTTKMVVETQDGHRVESVVMRHDKGGRVTLCVSSQVGCKMGCTFCATGTLGELGNLTSGEILEQLVHANRLFNGNGNADDSRDDPDDNTQTDNRDRDDKDKRRVSGTGRGVRNLVFMGMGEPLNNYDSVVDAIGPMTDPTAFGLAPSKVTVSTVGVVPKMRRLIVDAPGVCLALSLHAPNQALRERIVPTATAYKLSDILAALDHYLAAGGPKTSAMIEYCVLGGVNDSVECARELGHLMRDRDVIVNLIPYNPTDVPMGHEPPTPEAVRAMYSVLTGREFKVFTTVRHEMGQDISGACGQLALKKGPSCGSAVGGGSGGGTGDIEDLGGVVSKAKDGSGLRRRGGSHRKEGVMDDEGHLVENKEEKKEANEHRGTTAGGRLDDGAVSDETNENAGVERRPRWTWEDVSLVFLLVVAFGSFTVMVASLGHQLWIARAGD